MCLHQIVEYRSALVLLCSWSIACGQPQAGSESSIVAGQDSITVQDPDEWSIYEETYPNGQVKIKGQMNNGQREGQWTSYGQTGGIKSKNTYEQGKLNGPTVVFRDNGMTFYTGTYKDDRQVGVWEFFDAEGELVRSMNMDSTGIFNDQ